MNKILKNSNRIDVGVINILKKFSNTENDLEINWLGNRRNYLKKNPNTNNIGLVKGLHVYEKNKDEKYGECWFLITLKTNAQLNNWIMRL